MTESKNLKTNPDTEHRIAELREGVNRLENLCFAGKEMSNSRYFIPIQSIIVNRIETRCQISYLLVRRLNTRGDYGPCYSSK